MQILGLTQAGNAPSSLAAAVGAEARRTSGENEQFGGDIATLVQDLLNIKPRTKGPVPGAPPILPRAPLRFPMPEDQFIPQIPNV